MPAFKPQTNAVEGNVIYVLLLVVFVQTIYPITANNSPLAVVIYQAFYASLMFAGGLVVRDNPLYLRILVILGLAWSVSGTLYAFNQEATWALLIGYGFIAAFQVMVAYVLTLYLFQVRRVTRDAIYAACAVYLLIGAVFVPIYGVIETLTRTIEGTHAFAEAGIGLEDIFPWQDFIYYSYSTLTTLGYGDILPVTQAARAAAALEAIIGVLYMAIVIARLVGLYSAEEAEDDADERIAALQAELEATRRHQTHETENDG